MEEGKSDPTAILLNSTQEPSPDVTAVDLKLVKLCVYVAIFVLSVAGNTLVILSVLLFDKMKVVPNLFIANLAACDLTTTLFSIPFDLVERHIGFFPYGKLMCSVLWPLATFSTNSAALTLVAISCDRYLTIIHPLNFKIRITRRRCLKIIALLHLVSFVAILPYAVVLHYSKEPVPSCDEDWPHGAPFSKIYTFVLFVLQYAAPLLVMSVIYVRLGISLFKNTKEAHKLSVPGCEQSEESRKRSTSQMRKQQNDRITKMFLIVVVIFLVFMMPHQVLFLFYDYADSKMLTDHGDYVNLVCRAFTYTNAVLNAVIYGACNRSFRVTFKSIAKCHCSKAHQRERERKGRNLHLNVERSKLYDGTQLDKKYAQPNTTLVREKDRGIMAQPRSNLAVYPSLNRVKTITNKAETTVRPGDLSERSSQIASGNNVPASTTQDSTMWLVETGKRSEKLPRIRKNCDSSLRGESTDWWNTDYADVKETVL